MGDSDSGLAGPILGMVDEALPGRLGKMGLVKGIGGDILKGVLHGKKGSRKSKSSKSSRRRAPSSDSDSDSDSGLGRKGSRRSKSSKNSRRKSRSSRKSRRGKGEL